MQQYFTIDSFFHNQILLTVHLIILLKIT